MHERHALLGLYVIILGLYLSMAYKESAPAKRRGHVCSGLGYIFFAAAIYCTLEDTEATAEKTSVRLPH